MRHLLQTTLASALVLASTSLAPAPQAVDDERAITRFQQNVSGYMAIRSQVVAAQPVLPARPTWQQMTTARFALAEGLRAACRGTRTRLFTDDVHAYFRNLTSNTLASHRIDIPNLLAEIRKDVPRGAPTPRVHSHFAWPRGAGMPGCIPDAFPKLPTELEYRFVDRDLLIVDIGADLVLDILSDAIPRPRPVARAPSIGARR